MYKKLNKKAPGRGNYYPSPADIRANEDFKKMMEQLQDAAYHQQLLEQQRQAEQAKSMAEMFQKVYKQPASKTPPPAKIEKRSSTKIVKKCCRHYHPSYFHHL